MVLANPPLLVFKATIAPRGMACYVRSSSMDTPSLVVVVVIVYLATSFGTDVLTISSKVPMLVLYVHDFVVIPPHQLPSVGVVVGSW